MSILRVLFLSILLTLCSCSVIVNIDLNMGFFKNLIQVVPADVFPVWPESQFIAIPARPSTAELAEDLLVDPEALKLETHEPGVFDEGGEYVPQYSDDPKDIEQLVQPLDAPPDAETISTDSSKSSDSSEESTA